MGGQERGETQLGRQRMGGQEKGLVTYRWWWLDAVALTRSPSMTLV